VAVAVAGCAEVLIAQIAGKWLSPWTDELQLLQFVSGFKNPFFLKKSPTQWVFWVSLDSLDQQEKIGKIIQELSNLKP